MDPELPCQAGLRALTSLQGVSTPDISTASDAREVFKIFRCIAQDYGSHCAKQERTNLERKLSKAKVDEKTAREAFIALRNINQLLESDNA